MTTLFKFAYLEEQQKIFVTEHKATKDNFGFWLPPITCIYFSELDTVNKDGVMYSLKNDINAYIKARIEWEKKRQERMREEYEEFLNASENKIKALENLDIENDIKFFKTKEKG